MKYSIIIPTYNHLEDCLKPCVNSVIDNTRRLLNSGEAELIIVCNGCNDGTESWLKSLNQSFIKILSTDQLGYTRATNAGIAVADPTSEYFILLNNDCVILDWGKEGYWIELLQKPFELIENVAVTGPKKISAKDTGYPDKNFIVFFLAMISKKALKEFGNLDESFSPGGGEDIDFCFKAQGRGWKTLSVPEDVISSQIGGTTYPIWHRGEVTVHDDTSVKRDIWEAGFWTRMKVIGNRVECGYYDFKHEKPVSNVKGLEHLASRLSSLINEFDEITVSTPTELQYKNYLFNEATSLKRSLTTNANVLVDICTRGRYETSLPACLMSILSQTVLPKRIQIYCDDQMQVTNTFTQICYAAESKGVNIHITQGEGKGQVTGHEAARNLAKELGFTYVWRIDDDNFAEPNTLELLLNEIESDSNIGAVAGSVPDPNSLVDLNASTKIEHIFEGKNLQWSIGKGTVEADHLYSTFIYKVENSPKYRTDLSRIGHREETFFSYGIKLTGQRLRIVRDAITWHYRASHGGLRSETDYKLWEGDEYKFREWLQDAMVLKTNPDQIKPQKQHEKKVMRFNMNFGMGDHIMAIRALEKVIARLKDKKCIFYVCHHVAFDSYWIKLAEKYGITDWEIKSVGEGQIDMGQKEFDEISVYWWMIWHNWKDHAIDAMVNAYNEHLDKLESGN